MFIKFKLFFLIIITYVGCQIIISWFLSDYFYTLKCCNFLSDSTFSKCECIFSTSFTVILIGHDQTIFHKNGTDFYRGALKTCKLFLFLKK